MAVATNSIFMTVARDSPLALASLKMNPIAIPVSIMEHMIFKISNNFMHIMLITDSSSL